MSRKSVANLDNEYYFPRGFTISDNRIEDCLQRHITPSAYVVWRQYLRYWGSDKKYAYPSLALLSEKTGLSEKTIRKVNQELVKKGYLVYRSGNSKRANSYYYVPIEDIIAKYEEVPANVGQEGPQISGGEGEIVPPIKQHNKEQKEKITKELKKVNAVDRSIVTAFLDEFHESYKDQYGISYPLEVRDIKATIENIDELKSRFDTYKNLLHHFMKSRSTYVEESDHSLFFFFRPKVIKTLMGEFSQTDMGRWIQQSQRIIQELKADIESDKPTDLAKYLDEKSKKYLTGASKDRDDFVRDYIEKDLL